MIKMVVLVGEELILMNMILLLLALFPEFIRRCYQILLYYSMIYNRDITSSYVILIGLETAT